MNDKKRKRFKGIMTDIEKANTTVLRSFIICSFVYSVIGYFLFADKTVHTELWKIILYYILLFLPVGLGLMDYRDSRGTEEYRYTMYIPVLGFYAYLLLLDRNHAYFVMAVCLIGTAVIYCDTRFSKLIGYTIFVMHIIIMVFLYFYVGPRGLARLFQAFGVLVLSFFMNFGAEMILTVQRSSLKEINEQRQKIEALVSVGTKKLFEYDPNSDVMMLTGAKSNGIEYTRKIEKFSETAKQYRYILYADWDLFDEFLRDCRGGRDKFSTQMRLRNKKADYLWYQMDVKAVKDKEGRTKHVIGTLENVDELKRYELRQQDENMRDPLSKLYKRAYAKQLMAEFLNGQDENGYAGLLLIDIDDFSELCKEKGERFGDEMIRSIAADLDEIFYTSDILGRVGGDEFIVLMKYIRTPEDIDKKIREIQDVVRRTYSEEEMNFTSTVTIGAAVYPTDDNDFAGLYHKAEKALAYAKANGKDGYSFYDKDKEEEYADCHIEAKHNKIKMRNEQELQEERKGKESLTELAFRLIEESKDSDSAINLILRQVTREMELDMICIRRRVGREYKMVYPYSCVLNDNLPYFSPEIEMTQEWWEKEENSLRANNGLTLCGDTSVSTDESHRKFFDQYGVKAYARNAFYEKGDYIGSIDFVDCQKSREWTAEECKTMQSLTNVISAYLLKMKAFEDASDTVEKLTGYDGITDFYKYERFLAFTEEYLSNAEHGRYAIIYVDFSNFKFINETYGYEVGDQILRDYANAARSYEGIFIAGSRVFSDNMVCLVHMVWESDEQMRINLAAQGEAFANKVRKEYLESNLALSIGVSTFEVDGGEVLLKNIISNANFARKEAKKPDNPNCVVYSEEMGEMMRQEVAFINDMDAAFANKEFVVYMQPKIDLKSHAITGAEALIRWIKPDGTMIFPNDFIPVFEKNKTIARVDYFVYEEVCKYLAERIVRKERPIYVSMNVSRIHLTNIKGMVSYIKGLLEKYQIPPHMLEFELTETVLTDKVDDTILLMGSLRELGVKVSMDDFGSGYSSLNLLTKLPLDVLKLDKEFLKDFETDSDGKIIIPSIIDMAKKLRLAVVCEGVETKQQVEFLRQVDCDLVQGYYYSRPVPMELFSQMLADDDFVLNQETNK